MPTALLPFSLTSIRKKKVIAAFDGGQISSDGGVVLLAGPIGLLKSAVRIKETANRVRLASASYCPDAALSRGCLAP